MVEVLGIQAICRTRHTLDQLLLGVKNGFIISIQQKLAWDAAYTNCLRGREADAIRAALWEMDLGLLSNKFIFILIYCTVLSKKTYYTKTRKLLLKARLSLSVDWSIRLEAAPATLLK